MRFPRTGGDGDGVVSVAGTFRSVSRICDSFLAANFVCVRREERLQLDDFESRFAATSNVQAIWLRTDGRRREACVSDCEWGDAHVADA